MSTRKLYIPLYQEFINCYFVLEYHKTPYELNIILIAPYNKKKSQYCNLKSVAKSPSCKPDAIAAGK